MQDILNPILDEVRGAWRFRRWALAIAWVVCILGWLFVLKMPNQYEATARIYVDPSTLKPVTQGLAIEQDLNNEFNFVRQSMLSEPQLLQVINQTGIGGKAVTPAQQAAVVKSLRDRIDISPQRNPQDEQNAGPSKIYNIRYLDSTRERSMKVVDILLNNLMEQTLGGKRQASQTGQKFLETQKKDYEKRLNEAEDRLAEFQKRNIGMSPDQNGAQRDYFSRLQSEMDEVERARTALNQAVMRRDALQKQLRGEAPIAASGGMAGSAGNPGGGGDTVSQIRATQAKLDELLLRFTEKHPDVIAARETLAQLEKRRKDETEALKRGDPNAAALTGASASPVYQNIQMQLSQAEIEMVTARGALGSHQAKVAELQRMVNTMPQVEAEYARLNRDYTVTKTQYNQVVERLEKARLGEEAEATGSTRFDIIDPPHADFKPVSPNRMLFLVAVLAAGLAGGVAVAYLLNKLQPVFNDVHGLAEATQLPVLGSISLSRTDAASHALKRSYVRYGGAVGVLMFLFAIAVLVGRYFSPLGGA